MRATRLSEHRRVEGILFLTVFASCAYFHGGVHANQNARLNAIFAFVEPGTPYSGTFRIDGFLRDPAGGINTEDWTVAGGHYYANKAPGTILLGSLVYGALFYVQRWIGVDPGAPLVQVFNAYSLNLFLGPLWTAVGAVAFFRLIVVGTSTAAAALLSFALFLGTGLFPYSTQIWGHTTAAAFITLAQRALSMQTRRGAWLGGFWVGWAACTDYLAVLAVVGLGVAGLWRRLRDASAYVAGGVPALAAMAGYQWYCFGSPFTLATAHTNERFVSPDRALGMFSTPHLNTLFELSFGSYRGMLPQMPVLVLAIVGWVCWARRAPRDPWLWSCLATPLGALLVVSGFHGWYGGATVMTRYLLPFLPIAFVASRELSFTPRTLAWSVPVAAWSVTNMLAVAAVNPLVPWNRDNPLYGFTYPLLWQGSLSPYAFPMRLHQELPEWSMIEHFSMWNWGQLLGLSGLWSLAPLLVAWTGAALAMRAALRTVPAHP